MFGTQMFLFVMGTNTCSENMSFFTTNKMPTVVVIGGGIAGLAAAQRLSKVLPACVPPGSRPRVVLLEAKRHVGGWIESSMHGDFLFEGGPRTLRPAGAAARATYELLAELGLENKVVTVSKSHPGAKNRYIYCQGRLQMLPSSLTSLLTSSATSTNGLVTHALMDLLLPSVMLQQLHSRFRSAIEKKSNISTSSSSSISSSASSRHSTGTSNIPIRRDESVYEFIGRHFGPNVANYLIDPLIKGIYAGDARHLSVRSVFPQLWRFDSSFEGGSFLRGAIASSLKSVFSLKHSDATSSSQHAIALPDSVRASADRIRSNMRDASLYSLDGGLQTLTDALYQQLRAQKSDVDIEIRTDTKVEKILFEDFGAMLQLNSGENIAADIVLSAVPAFSLANLLSGSYDWNEIVSLLRSIEFVDVAVVNLGYEHSSKSPPISLPQGFGYLIPTSEKADALGVIFDSCSLPHQPPGHEKGTRMTVMMGGHRFKDVFGVEGGDLSQSGESILAIAAAKAMKTISGHLGIQARPTAIRSQLHRQCIPQYTLHHDDRMLALDNLLRSRRAHERLVLLGSSYAGVSVNDCINNSRNAVDALFAEGGAGHGIGIRGGINQRHGASDLGGSFKRITGLESILTRNNTS